MLAPDGVGIVVRNWDIFISHASEDAGDARWLREQLEEAGWRCFVAGDDLNRQVGSAEWSEVIDRVLDEAPVLALVVTPEALGSRWVGYEWRSVHDGILSGRPGMVIPICVRGPGPLELPRALRRYQCIDCRDAGTRLTQIRAAFDLISGLLRSPHEGPAPIATEIDRARPLPAVVTATRKKLAPRAAVLLAAGAIVAALAFYSLAKPEPPRGGTQGARAQPSSGARRATPCNCPPADPLCKCP
jgi:TIR domain-containing protein